MLEKTLVLIKPDGVERGIVGRIISRFEDAGLKIAGSKLVWVDRDFAKKHYSAHVEKDFYRGLEDFIVSGPIFAFVLEGVNSIQIVRKMIGSTEPLAATPGTIRGDFALHSYGYADSKKMAIKNLIHASENADDAKKEVELWFDEKEIHTYTHVHEKHVF